MRRRAGIIIVATICLLSFFGITQGVMADAAVIQVFLDGRGILFDQPPIMKDGRTFVPMRAIFEAMGAAVEWDGDTQTITGTKGDTVIVMQK